jgi:hypothetical protein
MHIRTEHIQDIFNNVIPIQQNVLERFSQYQEARLNNAFDFSHRYLDHSIETLKDIHLKMLEDRSVLKIFASAPLTQTIIESNSLLKLKLSQQQKRFNIYTQHIRRFTNSALSSVTKVQNSKNTFTTNNLAFA